MAKKETTEQIFEFKIEFTYPDSNFISERHFSASSVEVAKEMFHFACKKDGIEAEISKIEVWNRWANRWESPPDPVAEETAEV